MNRQSRKLKQGKKAVFHFCSSKVDGHLSFCSSKVVWMHKMNRTIIIIIKKASFDYYWPLVSGYLVRRLAEK